MIDDAWGTPMIESWLVERGTIAILDDAMVIHPSDMLLQKGKGRFPFESRFSLGVRELERDRRRYPSSKPSLMWASAPGSLGS